MEKKKNTHELFDTINHDHFSTIFGCPNGSNPIWLMIVECADGRFFIEQEFGNDLIYHQFEDVCDPCNYKEPIFYDKETAYNRAKEIFEIVNQQSH